MPEAKNVIISWNIEVWGVLSVSYEYEGTNPEGATEFQRYRNWELISWETANTYTLLITDQTCTIICAVAPFDNQGNQWEIEYSNEIFVEYYSTEIKPLEKQYIIKLYDWNLNFLKVISPSIITNDISITETINAWQGQFNLNLNLPIDTDYFNNARYCKVYMNDNTWRTDLLIYTWYISQIKRLFSNNSENIQVIFLSIYSLLDDVILRKNWDATFSRTADPSVIVKEIIDYFSTIYPWILSYKNDSIQTYWKNITIRFEWITCQKALKNLVDWLDYYLFIGADWIVKYKQKPATSTHAFTYWKDVVDLTIPENLEKIYNAVQVIYEIAWVENETTIAEDATSISKYWYKEILIKRGDLEDLTSAEEYRDKYLQENKDPKKDITITINTLYDIENIHPWDTIKVRNIWLNIENLQIKNIKYKYEEITLTLVYYTTIAEQIFNS